MTQAQSPDELFDVVDENDQVTGQNTRSEVHRLGLLHRAIHIFVFDSVGRLLLQKRSAAKDEFPSMWTSSASGHVDAGEDYDNAAARELTEELDLNVPLRKLQKFSACDQTANEFVVLYQATTDEPVTFPAVEIDAVESVEMNSLVNRIATDPDRFAPSFRYLFDWYIASFS